METVCGPPYRDFISTPNHDATFQSDARQMQQWLLPTDELNEPPTSAWSASPSHSPSGSNSDAHTLSSLVMILSTGVHTATAGG